MKINLHIERLVLDGLSVDARHGPTIQTAVERELARLLANRDGAARLDADGMVTSVEGGLIRGAAADRNQLGQQIATAVNDGLRGGR